MHSPFYIPLKTNQIRSFNHFIKIINSKNATLLLTLYGVFGNTK